jgi:hypothetical protein
MGFNDMKDTRLQLGIKAEWGGVKPTQIYANGSIQKNGVGLEIGYDFTDKKKEDLVIEGLTGNQKKYIYASEGQPIRQWQCESVCQTGDTPFKNPDKFKEIE